MGKRGQIDAVSHVFVAAPYMLKHQFSTGW